MKNLVFLTLNLMNREELIVSKWENVPQNIEEFNSFVYEITNKLNGRKYIGKKKFWFKKTLKPLKGMKRKRKSLVESDWKSYYGSSKELQADVLKYGGENFRRLILHHCVKPWDASYKELIEQIDRKVLFDPLYYNGIIQVRLRGRKWK